MLCSNGSIERRMQRPKGDNPEFFNATREIDSTETVRPQTIQYNECVKTIPCSYFSRSCYTLQDTFLLILSITKKKTIAKRTYPNKTFLFR